VISSSPVLRCKLDGYGCKRQTATGLGVSCQSRPHQKFRRSSRLQHLRCLEMDTTRCSRKRPLAQRRVNCRRGAIPFTVGVAENTPNTDSARCLDRQTVDSQRQWGDHVARHRRLPNPLERPQQHQPRRPARPHGVAMDGGRQLLGEICLRHAPLRFNQISWPPSNLENLATVARQDLSMAGILEKVVDC